MLKIIKFILSPFKPFLKRIGFSKSTCLSYYIDNPLKIRKYFLKKYNISLVVDVGANNGQYGNLLRKANFEGKIISFEPTGDAFRQLEKVSANDANWHIYKLGIGDSKTTLDIGIAENTEGSSFLKPTSELLKISTLNTIVAYETVKVEKLDDLYQNWWFADDNVMLKIDVEGFEQFVIDGAKEFIDKISIIEIELSFKERFAGQGKFSDIVQYITSRGFQLTNINRISRNIKDHSLVDSDVIFIRSDL